MTATTTASDIPARITSRLAEVIGERKYTMWFDGTAQFSCEAGSAAVRLTVPNNFVANWISNNFRAQIGAVAEEVLGRQTELEVEVNPAPFRSEQPLTQPATPSSQSATAIAAPAAPQPARSQERPGLSLRHRLEQFVVGPSNELAYAAALRLAAGDAQEYGPLFIHGGCGLGKTHLLQGICRRMIELDPTASIVYTTGEQFTNDFITAVRSNRIDAFRKRIRRLSLLAVDDVHFLADKRATQEEFLHSFEQIHMAGARVIMASDSHPRSIARFGEGLRSRCQHGLVVEVQPPDTQTRERLLAELSQRMNLQLTDDAASLLLSRWKGSVRELEGLLRKIHANVMLESIRASSQSPTASVTSHGPVQRQTVKAALADQQQSLRKRPLQYDEILSEVENQTGISRTQIAGGSRKPLVVIARSATIHLVRKLTTMSFPEIAAAMGKKNHSTVVTAGKRIPKLLEEARVAHYPGQAGDATPRQLLDRIQAALAQRSDTPETPGTTHKIRKWAK
ncbi:chromosomal replication initiator protein DnaA [Mucisphaera sp.]|uniref:chromosomal replication initiator protein DnaA n=1 Tax=Mucisphaera sp. TaxID=2913024 RepID=UPI003D0C506E